MKHWGCRSELHQMLYKGNFLKWLKNNRIVPRQLGWRGGGMSDNDCSGIKSIKAYCVIPGRNHCREVEVDNFETGRKVSLVVVAFSKWVLLNVIYLKYESKHTAATMPYNVNGRVSQKGCCLDHCEVSKCKTEYSLFTWRIGGCSGFGCCIGVCWTCIWLNGSIVLLGIGSEQLDELPRFGYEVEAADGVRCM